ncbi:MAG: S8 family serine peptidase [Candidatus Sumerlaeaceae bacterium]|nr:S8 family serine peptidase [Candidatus Sumerlaeaceae bacterium]
MMPVSLRSYFAPVACATLFAMAANATALDERVAKLTNDPNGDKISVHLLEIEKAVAGGQKQLATAAPSKLFSARKGALQVSVVCSHLDDAVGAKLGVAGAKVTGLYPQFNRANVLVSDLAALHTLAALPEVVMIRPSLRPHTRNSSVDGRAPRALRSDSVISHYGLTGFGQNIGILSDSFCSTIFTRDNNTLPAFGEAGILTGAINQDTGDLPPAVLILEEFTGDDFGFPADEGGAMGELVHDIAPNAALSFHTAFISEEDFAQGITDLRTIANCSIVVDDVGYFEEPVYQDGIVAQAAGACVANNVPYFSAAGNDANLGFRKQYRDVNARRGDRGRLLQGNDLHDWGGGNGYLPVVVPPTGAVLGMLNWNQPFQSVSPLSGARIDLDLYLTPTPDAAGLQNPVDAGRDVQGSSVRTFGDALEFIYFENTTLSPITVYLAVNHVRGNKTTIPQSRSTPLEFSLMLFDFGLALISVPSIPSGSSDFGGPTIFGHPTGPGVVSVGAVPWWEAPDFNPAFQPTSEIDPEFYTSRGGAMSVFFNGLGQFSPRTDFHPVVSAVDGNDTTFFITSDSVYQPGGLFDFVNGYQGEPDGLPNFFGTSAAAPNAAAVTALLKQADPGLFPSTITAILQVTARDVKGDRAAPDVDDTTGAGLIDARAAVDLLFGM